MIEPFKYLIQPVAIERDENGRILREIPGEILSVYSATQAETAIKEFETQLDQLNEQGGKDAGDRNGGVGDHVRQPELPGQRARPG
jgi:hypothetical protein